MCRRSAPRQTLGHLMFSFGAQAWGKNTILMIFRQWELPVNTQLMGAQKRNLLELLTENVVCLSELSKSILLLHRTTVFVSDQLTAQRFLSALSVLCTPGTSDLAGNLHNNVNSGGRECNAEIIPPSQRCGWNLSVALAVRTVLFRTLWKLGLKIFSRPTFTKATITLGCGSIFQQIKH